MTLKSLKKPEIHEQSDIKIPQREKQLAPFEEMERWIDEAFNRRFMGHPLGRWIDEAFNRRFSGHPGFKFPELRLPWSDELSPHVDIYEDEKEVIVKAELPGMKKADIDINISDDMITISGEKKAEEKVEKKNYFRMERSYGSFTRKLHLPAATISDKAKATFTEGVLEIRIPKTAEAQAKVRKIRVD